MSFKQKLKLWLKSHWFRALLLFAVAFMLGRWTAWFVWNAADDSNSVISENPLAACPDRLDAMAKERRQLREELAYLKQSVVVEQEACFGTRDALFDKERELSRLQEQLAFYRGIVSPEEASLGVRIYKFELRPVRRQHYQFALTLLQPVRQSKEAKGEVWLTLHALQGDKSVSYSLEELSTDDAFTGKYSFRYYTEQFGEFRLPDEIEPLRITVTAKPRSSGEASVTETFVWDELVAPQAAKER